MFPFLYLHFGFAVCRALLLSPLADWDKGDRLWVVLCTFKGTAFSSSRLCDMNYHHFTGTFIPTVQQTTTERAVFATSAVSDHF